MPPAPGLFSTYTGCPQPCESRSAINRATTSGAAPGGNGTIILTGLAGQVWARDSGINDRTTANPAAHASNRLCRPEAMMRCMLVSCACYQVFVVDAR